jgi:hypothetical protein
MKARDGASAVRPRPVDERGLLAVRLGLECWVLFTPPTRLAGDGSRPPSAHSSRRPDA